MKLTTLQRKVLDAAKEKIENEPWYTGISLDGFSKFTDAEITRVGIHNAVEEVIDNTMYWDYPALG